MSTREFDRFVRRHTAWLRARDLASRPWFLLGSAPHPALPETLPGDIAHVHVKYAGHSAKALGLPKPELTLLLGKTLPAQIEGLDLGAVLRMSRHKTMATRFKRALPAFGYGEFHISYRERDMLILETLGSLFGGIGDEVRPSNGISMIAYAIACGVPQVTVAGLSLTSEGHAYDAQNRKRRHRAEDKAALQEIARRYGQVTTTEPSLSELTGLALVSSRAKPNA